MTSKTVSIWTSWRRRLSPKHRCVVQFTRDSSAVCGMMVPLVEFTTKALALKPKELCCITRRS
jgi:hypothetical protein